MRDLFLEHPDITSALQTGYPTWNQPDEYFCELCGDEVSSYEIYDDFGYDILCKNCLLNLHKKEI